MWNPVGQPSPNTLEQLQQQQLDLGGIESEVARVVSPHLLKYNNSWADVRTMLLDALSDEFRKRMVDATGTGWIYSWHCMDHAGYTDNPRRKDIGYGNVFRFYRDILCETGSDRDEINWHFHPLSFSRNPLQCATSYVNSYDVLNQILCRRIIEHDWFPVTNRPGFHSERPDSHAFFEQWIPFDYANQYYEGSDDGQPDLVQGRFGDWRRAPTSWRGYHPHHDDYQRPGNCRRWIFRCLNVGTRFNEATATHLEQAFCEAEEHGAAIFAVANHDYRDIRPDVDYVRGLLQEVAPLHPGVQIRFAGATEAARCLTAHEFQSVPEPLKFDISFESPRLHVRVTGGKIFGPQPYLAIKTVNGDYYHDNLDVQTPQQEWTYTLDEHTLQPSAVETVAAASASASGDSCVAKFTMNDC